MGSTVQRPLAFTVQTIEEWSKDEDYGLLEDFFVLKLNGVEIYREKAVDGSGADDAEEWARGLAFKVLEMDWSKALRPVEPYTHKCDPDCDI